MLVRNYVLMKNAFGYDSEVPEKVLRAVGTEKGIEEDHGIWV